MKIGWPPHLFPLPQTGGEGRVRGGFSDQSEIPVLNDQNDFVLNL